MMKRSVVDGLMMDFLANCNRGFYNMDMLQVIRDEINKELAPYETKEQNPLGEMPCKR